MTSPKTLNVGVIEEKPAKAFFGIRLLDFHLMSFVIGKVLVARSFRDLLIVTWKSSLEDIFPNAYLVVKGKYTYTCLCVSVDVFSSEHIRNNERDSKGRLKPWKYGCFTGNRGLSHHGAEQVSQSIWRTFVELLPFNSFETMKINMPKLIFFFTQKGA